MKNKKILLSMVCAMVLVLTGCGRNAATGNASAGSAVIENGTKENAAEENTTTGTTGMEGGVVGNSQTTETQATITEEEAKKIALDDAGIAEADIKGLRIEKDREDGYYVYEVDFYSGNKEYDYKIDQTTGEIVGRDYEIENDFAY